MEQNQPLHFTQKKEGDEEKEEEKEDKEEKQQEQEEEEKDSPTLPAMSVAKQKLKSQQHQAQEGTHYGECSYRWTTVSYVVWQI